MLARHTIAYTTAADAGPVPFGFRAFAGFLTFILVLQLI